MTAPPPPPAAPRTAGRYELYGEIASGGMATVYFGRLAGPIGFSRIVAIKRMHPRLLGDPDFVAMFVDEATLASRVVHPNVVPTIDIVVEGGEIFIVMEYVRGLSLAALLSASVRAGRAVPAPIAAAIMAGALSGLHAAHEARDKRGAPLGIVHRDVSPQNILVGLDGVPRVMDFGVAKAERKLHVPQGEMIVGKASYMAPEQIRGDSLDRRADVFAAAVVLWSMLAGRRLFRGEDAAVMNDVLHAEIPPVTRYREDVPPALEAAIAEALARDPARRTRSARAFALALEAALPIASASAVGAWVEEIAGQKLAERDLLAAQIENTASAPAASVLAEVGRRASEARETRPDRQGVPIDPALDPPVDRAPDSKAPTRTWSPSTLETTPTRLHGGTPVSAVEARSGAAQSTLDRASSGPSRLSATVVMGASAAFATVALGAAVVVLMRAGAPVTSSPAATVATSIEAPPAASIAPPASAMPTAASSAPPIGSAAPAASAKAPPRAGGGRVRQKAPASKPGDDIGYIPSGNQ